MKTKTNDTENGSVIKPLLLGMALLTATASLTYATATTDSVLQSPQAAPVPSDLFTFLVDDSSLSHSEKWEMTVAGGGVSRTVTMTKFGHPKTRMMALSRDQDYAITLAHVDSKYKAPKKPDYDWDAQVQWTKSDGSSSGWQPDEFVLSGRARVPRAVVTASGGLWVLVNKEGLMGNAKSGLKTPKDNASGKIAWLKPQNPKIIWPAGSLTAATNPKRSWLKFPMRFDFQGVVAGIPGSYPLVIGGLGITAPVAYSWSLDAAAGSLTGSRNALPTHNQPTAEGTGVLTLKALFRGTYYGGDQRTVKIYKDHMARDYENWGTGIYHYGPWKFSNFGVNDIPMPLFNCHGSTWHFYNGLCKGFEGSIPTGAPITNVVVNHNPNGGGSHPSLGTLQRGDIIYYVGNNNVLMHSQTATGNGNETYGANNIPLTYPGRGGPLASGGNEAYKWALSAAGDWANEMWFPSSDPYSEYIPVHIFVIRP